MAQCEDCGERLTKICPAHDLHMVIGDLESRGVALRNHLVFSGGETGYLLPLDFPTSGSGLGRFAGVTSSAAPALIPSIGWLQCRFLIYCVEPINI